MVRESVTKEFLQNVASTVVAVINKSSTLEEFNYGRQTGRAWNELIAKTTFNREPSRSSDYSDKQAKLSAHIMRCIDNVYGNCWEMAELAAYIIFLRLGDSKNIKIVNIKNDMNDEHSFVQYYDGECKWYIDPWNYNNSVIRDSEKNLWDYVYNPKESDWKRKIDESDQFWSSMLFSDVTDMCYIKETVCKIIYNTQGGGKLDPDPNFSRARHATVLHNFLVKILYDSDGLSDTKKEKLRVFSSEINNIIDCGEEVSHDYVKNKFLAILRVLTHRGEETLLRARLFNYVDNIEVYKKNRDLVYFMALFLGVSKKEINRTVSSMGGLL